METPKTIIKYDSGKIKKVKIFKDDIDEKNYIKPLHATITERSRLLLDGSSKIFLLIPDTYPGMFLLKPIKYIPKDISRKDFIRSTNIDTRIGSGSYGSIWLTPEDVIYKQSSSDNSLSRDIIMEVAIYNLLRNIGCLPELYGFEMGENFKFYIEKGVETLDNFIQSKNRENIPKIIFRLCKCMRSISGQGVLHLDLKPQNIILDKENRIQIIDWGMAELDTRRKDFREKSFIKQTRWYRSPEIMARVPYGTKADTYSLGLIFLNMLIGTPLLRGRTDEEQAYLVLKLSGFSEFTKAENGKDIFYYKKGTRISSQHFIDDYRDIYKNCKESRKQYIQNNIEKIAQIDPLYIDLISGMLDFKAEFRSSWNDIILHPIFQKMFREDVPKYNILINNIPIIEDINIIYKKKGLDRLEALDIIHNASEKIGVITECIELAFQILDLYILNFRVEAEKLILTALACLYLSIDIYHEKDMGIIENVLYESSGYRYKPVKIYLQKVKIFGDMKGNIITSTYNSYLNFVSLKNEDTFSLYKKDDIYNTPFITKITGEKWKDINFWSI